jgi:hypothetical protein
MKWLRADVTEVGWLCKRIVVDGARVDMQWWQVPAATSVTIAYYWFRLCGSLVTYFAPGLMRERFDL